MSYDMDAINANCYEGTTCLINKFEIKDEKTLSIVEGNITFAKAAELEKNPIVGEFDTKHYKDVHRFLFGDLYDWAGVYRNINISKKGTVFADCNELESLSDRIFARFKTNFPLKDLPIDKFVFEISDLYRSLNMLHPFREGNGRCERSYITQLIRSSGYDFNFSQIDRDLLMIATIQSSQGVMDNLIKLFEQSIKKQG